MIAGSVHAQFARNFHPDRRKLSSKCHNFLTGIIFNFQRWRTVKCMPDERTEQVTDPARKRGGSEVDSVQEVGQGQCLLKGCSSYEPEAMGVFASCKISLPSNQGRGSVRENPRSRNSGSHHKAQAIRRSTKRLFERSNRLGNNICNWALGPGISSLNTRMMEHLNATECLSLSCVMHTAYSYFL